MLDLRNQLRKNFAQKKMNKEFMALMCLKSMEKFFNGKVRIFGYMKNWILFIKPFPLFAKNDIFLKKQEILKYINEKLANFGYTATIKDIIIK